MQSQGSRGQTLTATLTTWIPAHTGEDAVGSAKCGDGTVLTHELRSGNMEADSLAKRAALSVQAPDDYRDAVLRESQRVVEHATWLGLVTERANCFMHGVGGPVSRDSEGVPRCRRPLEVRSNTVSANVRQDVAPLRIVD